MVFSSLPFLFFYLPVAVAVYLLSPLKLRNLCLLVVSLFFYGWGEPVYISIMLLSIAVDYTHGLLVERWRDNDRREHTKIKRLPVFSACSRLSCLRRKIATASDRKTRFSSNIRFLCDS